MRLADTACALVCALLTFGCEQLAQSLGGPSGGDDGGASAATAGDGSASTKGAEGSSCAIEESSKTSLCAAISTCPSVAVDSPTMPHCGFRVRNGVADLVCACGGAICPMGAFTTCADAKTLLSEQTEQGVCVQLAEGRCSGAATPAPSSSPTSTGNPACDRQCMRDCGGGEACAAVCNCD
jgi:hypothetical protein